MIEKWVRAICSHCGESFVYPIASGWTHNGMVGQDIDTECPGKPIIMEFEYRKYSNAKYKIL